MYNNAKERGRKGEREGERTEGFEHPKGSGSFTNCSGSCFRLWHEQQLQRLAKTRTAPIWVTLPSGKSQTQTYRYSRTSDTCKIYWKKIHANARFK